MLSATIPTPTNALACPLLYPLQQMHWLVRYFRRNFHQVRPSVNQGRLPYCVNVGVYLLMNDKGEAPLFCYTGYFYTGYSRGGEHRV